MSVLLEILKYTIPGLVVFASVYYVLKMYMDQHYQTLALGKKTEAQKIILPIRLQAYERLMLLCDRIQLPNLLLRIRSGQMSVAELKAALMIAVAQEFDHNTSQQLYVSDTLWRILSLAKADTLTMITKAAEGLEPEHSDEMLVQRMFALLDQLGENTTVHRAQMAIRTEAGQLF